MESGDKKAETKAYAEAAEYYRKAVSLNPESETAIKALYKLGFTSETYLKDYEAAVFNYGEFIRRSLDKMGTYEVLKRLANIYFDFYQDAEKSITSYRRLIEFDKQGTEIDFFQSRIAQSYFRQNNFDQARIEYEALLQTFPKSSHAPRAQFEIGNTYFMQERYDIAIEAMKQVMRKYPQSEWAIEAEYVMAQSYEQAMKYAEALSLYEGLEGRYPTHQIIELRVKELKKRIKKEK